MNNNITKKYTSKLGYDASNPLIALPIEVNGNSTAYMTDIYYSNAGNRIALVSGAWITHLLRGCGIGTWVGLVLITARMLELDFLETSRWGLGATSLPNR